MGAFLEAVIELKPQLQMYLLKWNGAVVVAPGRLLPSVALSVFGSDRIHFALDGHHPFGACHHQKIVVADDSFAFCGGIDATENRWDTSEHLPDDPRRVCKDGSPAKPWHDVTSAMTGAAASALSDLSRKRWERATGEQLERPPVPDRPIWPEGLDTCGRNLEIAIARTEPPYGDRRLVNEIENLFLDSIKSAKDVIYIESQYFTAKSICDALSARLEEKCGPEVIVINPKAAQSDFENDAMHVLRNRMIEKLQSVDHQDRFRIYYPVNAAQEPIYVHAKIMIVDQTVIHLGSSNINDRSMGFDTECNVALKGENDLISHTRSRLLAEHLGVGIDHFDQTLKRHASLIATIDELNSETERGLRSIKKRPENLRGKILAKTRMMDQRYTPREVSTAGKGMRPRHVALIGTAVAIGLLGWQAWKWRRGNPRQ
ncbi:phospholipase D-like domain-containing protein [Sulfitobacter sp. F26204]|uniref:phospholipase D-like domain-containing protein n=1 Tax=Sulfitobacter sp. F26204 TaxID=2996014 RepID=UPI00225E4443|nr:phospholipase D-like domain-containing protein [Sulfitobacter sp. F26204]MCX7560273.1 phospholipase D-like domain-containing protein [Sulfitobacter sp. F26204]